MLGDWRHTWALICAGCRSTWITVPFGYDGLLTVGVDLATTKVKPTHSKSWLNPWSFEMIGSRCYIHDFFFFFFLLLFLLLLLFFQPGTVDSGQLLWAPCPETDSQHLCILMAICQGRGQVGCQRIWPPNCYTCNLFVQYSWTWCWRARM